MSKKLNGTDLDFLASCHKKAEDAVFRLWPKQRVHSDGFATYVDGLGLGCQVLLTLWHPVSPGEPWSASWRGGVKCVADDPGSAIQAAIESAMESFVSRNRLQGATREH